MNHTVQQLAIEIPIGKFVVRDDVTVHLFEGEVTVAHIVTSEIRARHVFQPWLETLAVRAMTPAATPVNLELVCIKDGDVATITCPISLTPDEAFGTLVDVLKLYLLNVQRPIPFDSDVDIHEEWSDLEEEEWQGEKLFRTHLYLGKPAWRLVFGDFSVNEITEYEPSPGYSIEDARTSIQWFLSHGIDLARHLVKAKR
jgi:exonuclease V gamma subunit